MGTSKRYNSVPCTYSPYMQLLGYIAWQWDSYLVPQNIFEVY